MFSICALFQKSAHREKDGFIPKKTISTKSNHVNDSMILQTKRKIKNPPGIFFHFFQIFRKNFLIKMNFFHFAKISREFQLILSKYPIKVSSWMGLGIR